MDRSHYGNFGRGLPDEEFALAVAGAMACEFVRTSQPLEDPEVAAKRILQRGTRRVPGLIDLLVESFDWREGWGQRPPADVPAEWFAQVWREVLDTKDGELSLNVIDWRWAWRYRGSLFDEREAISHPAVRAPIVVWLLARPSDGRSDWRVPVTIAAPSTHQLPWIDEAPRNHPVRFQIADRVTPQSNVLILDGGVRQAASAILTSAAPLRAFLVLITGASEPTDPVILGTAVDLIVAQTNAEGVAIVSADATTVAEMLPRLADDISHNLRIDQALTKHFGPATFLHGSMRLLETSWIGASLDALLPRLRGLGETPVAVTNRSRERLLRANFDGPGDSVVNMSAVEAAARISEMRSSFEFARESDEGAAMAELSLSIAKAERSRPVAPRYLQRKKTREREAEGGREQHPEAWIRGYVAGETAVEIIRIAVPEDENWQSVDEAFPVDRLPQDDRTRRLQIVLSDPVQLHEPVTRSVLLPPDGASSEARFEFTPKEAGRFRGRFSVLYRGRILQTSLLEAPVFRSAGARVEGSGEIFLKRETEQRRNWKELGARRAFDLAIFNNDGSDRVPSVTIIAKQRAVARRLENMQQPVERISSLLSRVADDPKAYKRGIDKGAGLQLMVDLAVMGRELYDLLFVKQFKRTATNQFFDTPDEIENIQVVSAKPESIVPVEFFYDRETPARDAKMCPSFKTALNKGKCVSNCEGAHAQTDYVCPMGFWGMRKIIERHTAYDDPLPDAADAILTSEPTGERPAIPLRAGAILGFSNKVASRSATPLVTKVLKPRTNDNAAKVQDWDDWFARNASMKPSVLIAYPHTGEDEQAIYRRELELGGGLLTTVGMRKGYADAVDGPPTMVFLLGCNQAGAPTDFGTPVGHFRTNGASVIVSTIATVRIEHAPQIGNLLINTIYERSAQAPVRLGEAMREVRRAALIKSLPVALALFAFGDVDWVLEQTT